MTGGVQSDPMGHIQDLIQRQDALFGHIIKMIDSGWVFIYDKPEQRAIFEEVGQELDRIWYIVSLHARVAALTGMAERLVNAGWDPVHVLTSSDNVRRIFGDAKECIKGISVFDAEQAPAPKA